MGIVYFITFLIVLGPLLNLYEKLTKTPEQIKREREEREEKERQLLEKRKQKEYEEAENQKKFEIQRQGFYKDNLNGQYQFMPHEKKKQYMYSQKWASIKEKIHARDKACVTCQSSLNLNVHHIHYLRLARENLYDLVLLCGKCHSELHKKKGYSRQGLYIPENTTIELFLSHKELIQESSNTPEYETDKNAYFGFNHPTVDAKVVIKYEDFETTTELDLSGLFLNEGMMNSFGLKDIIKLPNLRKLNLSSSNLSSLDKNIGKLIYLEELDLSNNNLTSLPKELGNLTNLKRLNISNNPKSMDIPLILDGLPFLDSNSLNSLVEKRSSYKKDLELRDAEWESTIEEQLEALKALKAIK
jgi:hypothetical protein